MAITTLTRSFTRDELVGMAYDYVRAGGRDTSVSTAEQILDSNVDSFSGRTENVGSPERDGVEGERDVPEEREDDDHRMVHVSRAGQFGADYVIVEIDQDEQCFVCPDCGNAIEKSCANGHQALSIEENFADVL